VSSVVGGPALRARQQGEPIPLPPPTIVDMTDDDRKTTVPSAARTSPRLWPRPRGSAAAAILAVEAAGLIVLLARTSHHVLLPITVDLPSRAPGLADTTPRLQLELIDVGVAAVVVLLLVAVARLVPPHRTARWTESALVSSITVFLVAQINGITDIGALVAIYGLTSAMVLFSVLQERTEVWRGHPMLPLGFGAAVGVVPWGIIAFHQIGAGIVGDPPTLIVRVLTLVMLAAAIVFGVTQWRELRGAQLEFEASRGEGIHVMVSVVAASAFAWLVVLGVVLKAL